ncbi:MAG: hypothetical protein RLY42_557, partial [Pseudomonadota bacterium]
ECIIKMQVAHDGMSTRAVTCHHDLLWTVRHDEHGF